MRKLIRNIIISSVVFFSQNAFGQAYRVSNIPDELKDNTYAVVRKDITACEVNSRSLLKVEKQYAITIFEKSGDFLSSFYEYYDIYDNIIDVRLTIYNADGKKIESFRKKDFDDYSASGYSLYDDTRVMVLRPHVNTYPYTIEYSYSTISKDFISLPAWFPVSQNHLSVESSEYKLVIPEEFEFNYKFFNIDKEFEVHSESGKIIYSASLSNIQARESEPYSPSWDKIFPYALVYPLNFERDDYEGSYNTWENFGLWVHSLRTDRDQLSEEAKQRIDLLVKGIAKDRDKVVKLYKFLQSSTRYVNISYGIGGYQPFPAMSVYENGYGDCKALSNYMYSLLKHIGIKSYYTLVYAGSKRRDIKLDFPSQQFNHVILSVPLPNDTLWLECTSQTNPPGYHGRFTDDRTVLLIDEEGGVLRRTKAYKPEDNLQIQNINVAMSASHSNLDAKILTTFRGQQYSTVAGIIHESKEDQKDYFLENIDIPQFEVNSFAVTESQEENNPVGKIELDLTIKNYTSSSGDRIFLPLNLMNKRSSAPKPNYDRINDFYLSYSYHDIDSIIYQLPDNYIVEYIPESISLSEKFADFSYSCEKREGEILLIRELKIRKGTYPKDAYNIFADFMKKVIKADNSKALIKLK